MLTKKRQETLYREFEKIVSISSDLLKKINDKEMLDGKLDSINKKIKKEIDSIRKISLKNSNSLNKDTSSSFTRGGFIKPMKISDELREFLDVNDKSEKFSRTEITRAICYYIKPNADSKKSAQGKDWSYLNDGSRNLQNPADKTRIIPDEKLSKLLKYDEYVERVKDGKELKNSKERDDSGNKIKVVITDVGLTYYIIQRLLKNHFINETLTEPKKQSKKK